MQRRLNVFEIFFLLNVTAVAPQPSKHRSAFTPENISLIYIFNPHNRLSRCVHVYCTLQPDHVTLTHSGHPSIKHTITI